MEAGFIDLATYEPYGIKEYFNGGGFSIRSAVWGGATQCDPNDPNSIGVC